MTVPVQKTKYICSQYLLVLIHLRSTIAQVSDELRVVVEAFNPSCYFSGDTSKRQVAAANCIKLADVWLCECVQSMVCLCKTLGGLCACGAVSRLCIVGFLRPFLAKTYIINLI